jgi:hypothetical protein
MRSEGGSKEPARAIGDVLERTLWPSGQRGLETLQLMLPMSFGRENEGLA